jgi:nucleoside phosphorylase/CheY-like chemotaxis protein
MKSKILVIDDRWNDRKQVYNNVLSSDFDVVAVEKGSEVCKTLESEKGVDVYLIDIMLSEWINIITNRPLQVMDVLEKIPKNKPIILLSNVYDGLVKNNELTPLINGILDKKYPVYSFFIWDDFVVASESNEKKEQIKSAIELDILKHDKIQKEQDANKFDFAVICALPEEMKPFMQKFSNIENLKIEGISVSTKAILTTKTGKELKFIAVTQTNMGMVDAAILGTILTSQFEIKHIFMIGVCGGRDSKVKIGSIIMPIEIVAYQNGKITEQGLIPNVKTAKCDKSFGKQILTQDNKDILTTIYTEAQNEIRTETQRGIDAELLDSIETDEMACGDVVVNKNDELNNIAQQTSKPKLCAVDMESYSIYRLAELLKVDATVIKTVMDLTSIKTDKYKDYAAKISAKFLYSMLYEEIINL